MLIDFEIIRDHPNCEGIVEIYNPFIGYHWVSEKALQQTGSISTAAPDALPCDECELESGCIMQPFTKECKEYRRR